MHCPRARARRCHMYMELPRHAAAAVHDQTAGFSLRGPWRSALLRTLQAWQMHEIRFEQAGQTARYDKMPGIGAHAQDDAGNAEACRKPVAGLSPEVSGQCSMVMPPSRGALAQNVVRLAGVCAEAAVGLAVGAAHGVHHLAIQLERRRPGLGVAPCADVHCQEEAHPAPDRNEHQTSRSSTQGLLGPQSSYTSQSEHTCLGKQRSLCLWGQCADQHCLRNQNLACFVAMMGIAELDPQLLLGTCSCAWRSHPHHTKCHCK